MKDLMSLLHVFLLLYFLATVKGVAMLQHLLSYGFGLAYDSSDHRLKPISLRQKLVIVAFTLLVSGIRQSDKE